MIQTVETELEYGKMKNLRILLQATLTMVLLLSFSNVYAERGIGISAKGETYSQKIALIIGNSAYSSNPLRNPRNDAEDIAKILRELGFQVTTKIDGSRITMMKEIKRFGTKLKKGGVGLFFYAGHGVQVSGKNYLIPVDADIESEDEVQYYAVDAGMVLSKMQSAGNPLNMVFLDACRNNPFARSFRSSSRGLAQMDAPKGSLIVYATAPGSTAADGSGRNGIFTKNLMKHMQRPGVEVGMMLRDVRTDVLKETGDKQIPWDSSSLTGRFYFIEGTESTERILPSDTMRQGLVHISSQVSNFQIYVDHSFRGYAPLSLSLNPGTYQIQAKKGGFTTQTKSIHVLSGKQFNISFDLKLDFKLVFDPINNLTWQIDEPGKMNYQEASNYCENMSLSGYSDWRLPNLREINAAYYYQVRFPNVQPAPYWAYTHTDGEVLTSSYAIDFKNRDEYWAKKTSRYHVRCMRGGIPKKNRRVDIKDPNRELIIFNPKTNLTWQVDGTKRARWQEAMNYCETLYLAGKDDWRIPKSEELTTGLNIESELLNFKTSVFWSSTNCGSQDSLVSVSFINGYEICDNSSSYYFVRCIRDGQTHYKKVKKKPITKPKINQAVIDKSKGLMWQNHSPKWMDWETATQYCENLDLIGFSDWRLPESEELFESAVRIKDKFPKIEGRIGKGYWSSDTVWYRGTAINVNLRGEGKEYGKNKNTKCPVRCVRMIQ